MSFCSSNVRAATRPSHIVFCHSGSDEPIHPHHCRLLAYPYGRGSIVIAHGVGWQHLLPPAKCDCWQKCCEAITFGEFMGPTAIQRSCQPISCGPLLRLCLRTRHCRFAPHELHAGEGTRYTHTQASGHWRDIACWLVLLFVRIKPKSKHVLHVPCVQIEEALQAERVSVVDVNGDGSHVK